MLELWESGKVFWIFEVIWEGAFVLGGEIRGWYEAFRAKDARFDGRFFVGVRSTGIYCRPVCRARLPRFENCEFYGSAAEAEGAGFRPCLLCRPEVAPGSAPVDARGSIARKAARLLEEGCGSGEGVVEVARRLGCSDRHLRRVFGEEFNVSPVQYLQTCRLLLAKGLLTDTGLSVIDVAMASGFGSLRRFNDLFRRRYRLTPGALRKEALGDRVCGGEVSLALGYRPPYEWERMLAFLEGRSIAGVEVVRGGEYWRVVRVLNGEGRWVCGWVRVGHGRKGHVLRVTVDSGLLCVLPQVLSRVRGLFDLYCEPEVVFEGLRSMEEVWPGSCVLGTRLPGCFDAFEMAVRAVLGQQVTVKAAGTLAGRLAERYGTKVETGVEGLERAFPLPEEILGLEGEIEDRFGVLGVTGARSRTILGLARAFVSGDVDLSFCGDPEEQVRRLMGISGIGPWTAQYVVMRAMGWTDAFLDTDYGVKKALAPRSSKEMLALAEGWSPWRSYAVVNLWNSL